MKGVFALLGLLVCALEARAAPPACRAEVLLEPPRAMLGEQVLYRVRVLRRDEVVRVDWAQPPVFPSARAEALPPEPRADVRLEGVAYHVHDEVRALFPERAGALRLGGAALRCELEAGDAQQVPVPEVELTVEALPEAGRPPDFAGLVGPLLLHLTVTPERVELGQAVRVAVLARGSGNLWLLEQPFPEGAFGSAEVFERPAELVFERGNALFLRQHLALDVVPREAGSLRVPALEISYFDPVRDTYRVATTEEVQVLVEKRAAVPRMESQAPTRQVPTAEGARGGWLVPLAAALAAGAGVAAWRWRRRAADATAQALQAAAAARRGGDLDAEQRELSRALRSALARYAPQTSALGAEELAALPDLPAPARAAANLLQALERARFERGAPAVGAQEVVRALRALDASRHAAWHVQAGAGLLLVGTLAAGALASGCASTGTSRDEPMTPARLEAWLRDETDGFEEVEGQLRFLHGGVRMICLHDVRSDRLRLVAAVSEESALTVVSARILLQANFGNTLDARYAIRDGVLYAVYLHPLSTLASRDLEAALDQVANLVRNFGTSFSAVEPGTR